MLFSMPISGMGIRIIRTNEYVTVKMFVIKTIQEKPNQNIIFYRNSFG